ncbi:unnamed protein product [Adineta steineri]|uniref:Peptidase C1A papain C-terminal domain-containing protein n=1 Tax=Adineta steineri TaxID=433720 RepID=A0A814CRB3_9BILA|nr:unnamed protein product [Adineta steineri]CAF1202684.1 unnamed protein product [Adineta steineri]
MPLKSFLTSTNTSQRFRVNGLIPSSRLPNKRQLCQSFHNHVIYRADQLPPKVDLRSDMTPVEDQSQIGSCVANSLAGAYEYLTKKANGRNTDVSRLFIYYNARVKDESSGKVTDSGCTMTSAIEALEEYGTCLESLWPYDISEVNSRPNSQSYHEASHHKITEALKVNINLHEMKSCLAQGFPFAFGLKLYSSFDQAAKTGVVPMPNTGDNGRSSHGSHALLAIGYSDQSNAFIVRNSWGENWGDQGYCYIPYQYMTDSSLCFDVWTVRKLAMDSFGREHWDDDDRIDYSRSMDNDSYYGNIDRDSSMIETFNDNDDYDDSGSFNRTNDYRRNNGFNDYRQNNGFDDPWNSYQDNGGNNYSNYGNNYNYNRNNTFDDPWNSPRTFQGFNQSRNDESFQGNFPDPGYNQFQQNNDFFDFPNNPFMPSAPFQDYQQYGSGYGYTNSYDTPFNPFF